MRTQLLAVVMMCASCDLDSRLPAANDDAAGGDGPSDVDAPVLVDGPGPDAAPVVDTWISTAPLTPARFAHSAVARGGRLYVFGGQVNGSSRTDDVQMAAISPDGTLGSWSATTGLPVARAGHVSVEANGYVYVLGGCCTTGAQVADVFYAPINPDGSLGTWASTTALPSARQTFAAVAHNGRVYAIAGNYGAGGINRQDVQVATVNGNGSLGAWSALTQLPSPWTAHSAVAATVAGTDYLYVIGGGRSGEEPNGDVLVATIAGNGTIGGWTNTTALPIARAGHTSVELNGAVFVMGGAALNGGNGVVDMNQAALMSNGNAGAWTAKAPLPVARAYSVSVVANGRIYVIGGLENNTTALGDVHVLTPSP